MMTTMRKGSPVRITSPDGTHTERAWLVERIRWDRDIYVVADANGCEITLPDGWTITPWKDGGA